MINTKKRHLEIYNAAVKTLDNAGGVQVIDGLSQEERIPQLRQMAKWVVEATDCHIDSAKRNLAKAMRRARFAIMQEKGCKDPVQEDNWGGGRPNTGPAPKAEGQTRQRVSTRLDPGSKELFQAIAEALDLPGWGHAVDLAGLCMVEGDPELKVKLAEMGIVVKGNDGKGLK